MSNLNVTTGINSTTSNTSNTTGGGYCSIHGYGFCNCYGVVNPTFYPTNFVQCGLCKFYYDPNAAFHTCSRYSFPPVTGTGITSTGSFGIWNLASNFKEVKEITTDSELTYEWGNTSFHLNLPQQFSDCFLKVGYSWSPLYPLIFSAYENDSKELSFHLVVGITEKVFEGGKVILKGVSTTKIEDNLTLMQLTNRTRQYFEDK